MYTYITFRVHCTILRILKLPIFTKLSLTLILQNYLRYFSIMLHLDVSYTVSCIISSIHNNIYIRYYYRLCLLFQYVTHPFLLFILYVFCMFMKIKYSYSYFLVIAMKTENNKSTIKIVLLIRKKMLYTK